MKRGIDSGVMTLPSIHMDGHFSPVQQKKRKQFTLKRSNSSSMNISMDYNFIYVPQTFLYESYQNAFPDTSRNVFFNSFPRELYAIIFSFLDRASLCHTFRVCKSWSKQSANEYLWKLLYERDVERIPHTDQSWKYLYRHFTISDGIDISLVVAKQFVHVGEDVALSITVENKKKTDTTIVVGFSSFGIAFENGSLLRLTSNNTEMLPVSTTPLPSDGSYMLTSIAGKSSIKFMCVAQCRRINDQIYYVLGGLYDTNHAILIPASTHSLALHFEKIVPNSASSWCGSYVNQSAPLWKGKACSNGVTLHCLQ